VTVGDRSLDLVRFMRKAVVRCQPDGIGSLAAALTQCPAEVRRLPVTEKQQAECTIESDGTGVFVVFEGVRIAKEASPARHMPERGCHWNLL
jgi:hypothetical protein